MAVARLPADAAAAPATYLLQRDLNFRAVGLVQVGSYAAGYLAWACPWR
jgi:lipopolysaccharide exporter